MFPTQRGNCHSVYVILTVLIEDRKHLLYVLNPLVRLSRAWFSQPHLPSLFGLPRRGDGYNRPVPDRMAGPCVYAIELEPVCLTIVVATQPVTEPFGIDDTSYSGNGYHCGAEVRKHFGIGPIKIEACDTTNRLLASSWVVAKHGVPAVQHGTKISQLGITLSGRLHRIHRIAASKPDERRSGRVRPPFIGRKWQQFARAFG
jgi:hypothetical protein